MNLVLWLLWWRQRYPWRLVVRAVALILTAAVLIGMAVLWIAAPARADTIGRCQTGLWGFLFSQRRELCDGPVHADGSWLRRRVIYVPAHNVPLSCSTYGGGLYFASTTCSGGYFQPYAEVDREIYPVTPDTVLPDEPGHLA